jgi:hypothetical protein
MTLNADIVAVSPSSVWRVLSQAGLLSRWNGKWSKKSTGFEQPLAAHQHWHIDVSCINISGTFYYLCSILDGCSRYYNVRLNGRLRHAEGCAGGAAAGDPGHEGSGVGGGAKTAAASPAAGCVKSERPDSLA